ncbi:MAG TPA: 16S rRNA (guanine(527)-N(7))-methyltransferase RsmG [Variovorax sp.]|nr:16S rRNA (guanine(527)-N(7))-methyltransferase RsmG [Variovorax sp.]
MSQDVELREGARALGIELTDRQCERLMAYGALILKWNKVYNLTALRDPALVLTHHLLDSLSVVVPLQRQKPAHTGQGIGAKMQLLDVGAGAGLPGVVIAILRDDIHVTCLDAVAKKAAFVQQVAVELALPNLRGLHARVETLTGGYDIVSCRAFASLGDFYEGSRQLLAPGAVWMAMKGKMPDDELAQLPGDVDVFHVEQLHVPGLDAERCLVWARAKGG